MKQRYFVAWSDTAERDLLAIVEYIADDSVSRAYSIFKEIKAKAATLHPFPERDHVVPELQEHGIIQYRELITGPWRIIYRVSEKHVYVLSVIDSRRSVEDILLRRLTGQRL
ncbi:MAG: Plasmid stabilization system protein [Syntrophorhabdus sp. PtaB.Bin006]|nr:MAG: Plasmid stabilization system protein [Syntrophorhabdus sp. PtaB.Bin006]